jgi:hypothetical protein
MCVYCKAASAVLDDLWKDTDFRSFFHHQGYELIALGPLTHDIFVPAYLDVKRMLQGGTLEMLEAQVTGDLLAPLYRRSNFREMWEAWDQATRDAFLREQSELKLSRLLIRAYSPQLGDAYQQAFWDFLHPR